MINKQFYKLIPGVFTSTHIYNNIYTSLNSSSINSEFNIVELNVGLGKSSFYLNSLILNNNTQNKFNILSVNELGLKLNQYSNIISKRGNTIESTINVYKTVSNFKDIQYIELKGLLPNNLIKDNSIDFLFININEHLNIKLDVLIKNWIKKIKVNGFIGGNDYKNNTEIINSSLNIKNNTEIYRQPNEWLYKKPVEDEIIEFIEQEKKLPEIKKEVIKIENKKIKKVKK